DLKQSDYKKKTQENTNNCEETKKSTRYFNGFDIRFFDLLFGDCNGKNSILHSSFDLIHFYILRKPEPPHELPAAPLHPVPRVVLIFLLNVPLSADVEDSIIFDLHLHLFLLQPRNIGSEHSTRALTKAEFSSDSFGKDELDKGKSLNGSQTSREKGSKTLLRRPPKKLGMSDMFSLKYREELKIR
ncbi:hypothetical protein G4B88_026241, partial [Cannabis sativa]